MAKPNTLFVAHESRDNTFSVRGELQGEEFMIREGFATKGEAEALALRLVNLYRAMATEVRQALRLG